MTKYNIDQRILLKAGDEKDFCVVLVPFAGAGNFVSMAQARAVMPKLIGIDFRVRYTGKQDFFEVLIRQADADAQAAAKQRTIWHNFFKYLPYLIGCAIFTSLGVGALMWWETYRAGLLHPGLHSRPGVAFTLGSGLTGTIWLAMFLITIARKGKLIGED